ncbi:GBS Bsp-like repeat-containing protein [Eubacterium limosum]|uniref:GBS Bsp-like repeat-containing protein n=1 Tax=Eubacterium limosum TaxID=1736 RepID=UPI003724B11F
MEKRKQKSFPLMLTLAVLVLFMLYQAIGCFPVHARAPVVVINPGHSVGTDPGATNTVTYVQEADLNAAIAAKTAERLKSQGYEVYLTQPVSGCSIPSLLPNISDSNSLVKVANAINAKNPDLALAIHHNSDGNKSGGSASGYELYWSSYRDFDNVGVYEVSGLWGGGLTAFRDNSPCYAAQQSEVFAGMVKSALDGFDIKYNKTVERDDYLPAHTRCPSILFEGGYVSNDSESRLLANDWHQNATADRLVNAINAYFGRYGDTEAPIADSVTTPESSTTNTVFTVTANNVSDKGAGVKNVRFAVWTSKNGQDDIQWNDGKNDGNGNWSYQIDINDHDEQFGEYIVHVYAMDFAGNDGFIGDVSISVTSNNNAPSGISCMQLSNTLYKVYAKGFSDYSGYQFPVWSNNGGQDDIIWYQGIRQTDGSYASIIDIKDHGHDVGDYTVHVYANNGGKTELLGATRFNVKTMTAESVTASEVKDGKFTVSINGISAPSGIKQIQVPTWSENNGQDDTIWYTAKRKDNQTYTLEIDIKNHGYDVGKYLSHVYGIDNNGKQIWLGATSTSVPQMTAESVTASEVKDGKFTVSINGISAPSGIKQIQVPTWSENNGQDDTIWYTAKRKDNQTYTLEIDIKNHGYDVGKYLSHVYGIDNNGKQIWLGATSTSVPQMTAESVTASEVKDGKFTVSINGISAPSGIKQIQVPTWSENNGQDDTIWYTAKRKDNQTYTLEIDIKNHGYDVGKYLSHVYGIDNNGKQIWLGATSTSVPQMTAESVTASEVKDGKFTVSINGISAPSGIKQIQVPTWSENNGQDDIVWYTASEKSNGIYQVIVDLTDHHYDTGNYTIHCYGVDKNGGIQFLGSTSILVQKDDIPDNIDFSIKTSVMGNSSKSAQKLADHFSSKAAFPTSFYGMSAVDFANIYIEECKTEGVRPEVAFAQMCLETGYLQYGGDVKREQFNFAGIGAIGNGAPGNSFTDVRTGIRAQVQHLKAYASTEGLVNECVDPRYQYVKKGCAPTVGDLAGKWASDVNYGNKLVTVMNAF